MGGTPLPNPLKILPRSLGGLGGACNLDLTQTATPPPKKNRIARLTPLPIGGLAGGRYNKPDGTYTVERTFLRAMQDPTWMFNEQASAPITACDENPNLAASTMHLQMLQERVQRAHVAGIVVGGEINRGVALLKLAKTGTK